MSSTTAMYIAQTLNGLSYGMLLFLVASGLTLIFGMMGILNIAHAGFFMLSAYFCITFLQLTGNFWLALLVAPIITAFLGVLCEYTPQAIFLNCSLPWVSHWLLVRGSSFSGEQRVIIYPPLPAWMVFYQFHLLNILYIGYSLSVLLSLFWA